VVDEINTNVNDGTPEAKRTSHADNGDSKPVDSPTSNEAVDRIDGKTAERIRKQEKIKPNP